MVTVGAFAVKLQVGGVDLPELDDPESLQEASPNTKTVYVEAQPDQEYAITYHVQDGHQQLGKEADYLAWDTYIDGRWVPGSVMRESVYAEIVNWRDSRMGRREVEGSRTVLREFQFRKLKTRDHCIEGETRSSIKKRFHELGSVKIKVWRKRLMTEKQTKQDRTEKDYSGVDTVPQKASADLSCSVSTSFAETRLYKPFTVIEGEPIDDAPLATLIIKYRTKEDLYDLGIIERPLPLDVRPLEILNAEEREQLFQQLYQARQDEREQQRIKAEARESVRRIKRELETEDEDGDEDRKKKKICLQKDCIDLTGDGDEVIMGESRKKASKTPQEEIIEIGD